MQRRCQGQWFCLLLAYFCCYCYSCCFLCPFADGLVHRDSLLASRWQTTTFRRVSTTWPGIGQLSLCQSEQQEHDSEILLHRQPATGQRRLTIVEMEAAVESRRSCLNYMLRLPTVLTTSAILLPSASAAAAATTPNTPNTAAADIRLARETLQTLLVNWERAVVDCTFADVPRELLQTKNKELLLEKATTSALFDKSGAIVSCKTTNRIVRDYLGSTGKGPLKGIDKLLSQSLDSLQDPDRLDDYIQATERVLQALSRADSYSYAAGKNDFTAVNNFDASEKEAVLQSGRRCPNLVQTKFAIQDIIAGLDELLALLGPEVQ